MVDRVLIADDDQAMGEMVADALRSRGLDPLWVSSGDGALEAVRDGDVDLVLADLNMPGLGGIELCRWIVTNRPGVPVVVVTAYGSLDTAVEALRAGAHDFVTKPVDLEVLGHTVARALEHRALSHKVRRLSAEVDASRGFGELLGESEPMRKVYSLLGRLASSEASVLITGESGTGKELVARGLHEKSVRADGPFVAANCAAFPEHLLESELFGHVKGAFTDAKSSRDGLFQRASGGTLLLDELGELPLALQPKLLRALEERVVRPVGSDREVPFDTRIIAATNRDLRMLVDAKTFREDLLYRIAVVQVEVPPLRARGVDILLLARHFLKRYAERAGRDVRRISQSAAEKLLTYSWPGNVRELRNAMERCVALARLEEVTVDDLPPSVRTYEAPGHGVQGVEPGPLVSLEEVERRYIAHVLEVVKDNQSEAARLLGIDRKTLYRRLKKNDDPV